MITNNFKDPSHPWPKIGKHIESLCRKALYKFDMLKDVKSVAIALSGGKDSLALLYLLSKISGRGFPLIELHAIHVENIFLPEADITKNYLKKVCDSLNVNLIFCKSFIPEENLECYSCARERRKLIFKTAKTLGCETIAFGHTKDDNIQTLLLNLFQKADFSSILPKIKMYRFDVTIIRPLILIEEKDILQFATYYNFFKSKHICPKENISYRKKVEDLLSEIEKVFPKVRSNLALSAFLYGSDKAARPLD
jgi:tRNA(Ile)-lysidine synthase TilS/MesJ